jgi:hypothetical protein
MRRPSWGRLWGGTELSAPRVSTPEGRRAGVGGAGMPRPRPAGTGTAGGGPLRQLRDGRQRRPPLQPARVILRLGRDDLVPSDERAERRVAPARLDRDSRNSSVPTQWTVRGRGLLSGDRPAGPRPSAASGRASGTGAASRLRACLERGPDGGEVVAGAAQPGLRMALAEGDLRLQVPRLGPGESGRLDAEAEADPAGRREQQLEEPVQGGLRRAERKDVQDRRAFGGALSGLRQRREPDAPESSPRGGVRWTQRARRNRRRPRRAGTRSGSGWL